MSRDALTDMLQLEYDRSLADLEALMRSRSDLTRRIAALADEMATVVGHSADLVSRIQADAFLVDGERVLSQLNAELDELESKIAAARKTAKARFGRKIGWEKIRAQRADQRS